MSDSDEWTTSEKKCENASQCIIHCCDAKEKLTSLQSLESWKVLVDAARIQNHHAVLHLAETVGKDEYPNTRYHRRCRSIFTHKKSLDQIEHRKAVAESSETEVTHVRRSVRDSVDGRCNILPRKCIFCHSEKFLKNSRTREKLSNCMQIRADITVRKVAKERNDTAVLAITADELIAKEACYHWSCYREYTRKKPLKLNCKAPQEESYEDENYVELWRSLNNLVENPDVVEFTKFKSMIHAPSGKKNLRRKIEQSTNDFHFVNVGKELLIYPNSLKMDNLVCVYYDTLKKVKQLEKMDINEKMVVKTARVIKDEIRAIDYRMPWPPKPPDLNVLNFVNPQHLDLFLSTLLLSDSNKMTDRISRLKLSFGQDLTYAGLSSELITRCFFIRYSIFGFSLELLRHLANLSFKVA